MGVEEFAPSAPTCCAPDSTAPSAPPVEPSLAPGEEEVLAELRRMGLAEWLGELLGAGVKSRSAFMMIEEVADLPAGLPALVKKQIVKRGKELAADQARVEAAEPITITVKIVGENRQFDIEVKPNARLADIRHLLDAQRAPTPNKICFDSTTITDAMPLHDANIVHGSVLFLIPVKSGPVELFMKTSVGAVSTMNVVLSSTYTVGHLKAQYAATQSMNPAAVQLTYDGVQLIDDSLPLNVLHKEVVDGSVFRVG